MADSLHRFGAFELDTAERRLRRDGVDVALRPRPFDLLRVLVERAGRLVTKDELLERAWPGVVVEENNLQVQVSVLRKLLGHDAIATVARSGYRFTLPLQPAAAPAPAPRSAAGAEATVPASALFGREADLDGLLARMREARLVTLVGPGGIGKTRLAQVALAQAAPFVDGPVHWVDLASLPDAALLPSHVAGCLGLPTPATQDVATSLTERLADAARLLVLDNAEHLVDAVAAAVAHWLRAAPRLRLLVTSQVPLRVAGESVLRLEPLAIPEAGVPADQAGRFGAVALFAARARAVDRRFELNDASLPAVLEICRGLDGMPLALELAAARVPSFGLVGVARHLRERFRLFNAGHRDAPDRQRTLAGVFDWSVRLLGPVEQAVYARLGTLVGSFTLEQAGELAIDPPGLTAPVVAEPWQVYDALAVLVDRSLLVMDDGDPPRYRMLESARAYALQRLRDSGETGVIERASRAYEALGDRAAGAAAGSEAMTQFSVAHELVQLLPPTPERDRREIDVGIKLGPALQATLGPTHPRCEEVYRRCVDLARGLPPDERAYKALWGYWQFLMLSGREREAATHADEIVLMAPKLRDDGLELEALHASMSTRDMLGDAPGVVQHARRINARYDRCRHHALTFSFGGHDLGVCALGQGAFNLWLTGFADEARAMATEALSLAGQLDHGYSRATGAYYGALTYWGCGDTDALERTARALVDLSDQYGMAMLLTEGRLFLGRARHERGLREGIGEMRQALQLVEDSRDLGFAFIYFAMLADALIEHGELADAETAIARALGYADLGQGLFVPELYRLRGSIRARRGDIAAARSDFEIAATLARQQGAAALELRALLSAADVAEAAERGAEGTRLATLADRVAQGGATRDTDAARAWLAAR